MPAHKGWGDLHEGAHFRKWVGDLISLVNEYCSIDGPEAEVFRTIVHLERRFFSTTSTRRSEPAIHDRMQAMSRARTIDVAPGSFVAVPSEPGFVRDCRAGAARLQQIPSMRRSSSSLNEVFLSAPMLSISCCGRDAPTSTEATMPSCSSQASDISASVCPRSAARSFRSRIC